MSDRRIIVAAVMLPLVFFGCNRRGDSNRKPTFPVTGTVHVDGQPASGVRVTFHDTKGMDPVNPTHSSAFTDEAGKFIASTYDLGDGVPDGEYKMTFEWKELQPLSMEYGGPDKLKDRYSDPEKSEFTVTVSGKPVDLGVIDLKTK